MLKVTNNQDWFLSDDNDFFTKISIKSEANKYG